MTSPQVFACEDFFEVAQRLFAIELADEGCERSAIGRAYYACFHAARVFAILHNYPLKNNGTDHMLVRRALEKDKHFVLAARLLSLHEQRKDADYDIPFPGRIDEASLLALIEAEGILKEIKALP